MHSIHLRDPWQCETTEDGVRWLRVFHRPTGLTDRETVWLVVSPLSAAGVVTFNDQPLRAGGDGAAARLDITRLLAGSNRVVIELPHPAETRPFDVRLEIVG